MGLAEAVKPELLKFFKPAISGRCTVVTYYPLADDILRKIIELLLHGPNLRRAHAGRHRGGQPQVGGSHAVAGTRLRGKAQQDLDAEVQRELKRGETFGVTLPAPPAAVTKSGSWLPAQSMTVATTR